MRDEIRRIHERIGVTMIYVTHDQKEALSMAGRLAVMDKGRVRQVGTPREVYTMPRDPFVAGFIGETNLIGGKILERKDRVLVETAYGNLTAARVVEGVADDVACSIRPEAMSVATDGQLRSGGAIEGTVESVVYLGGHRAVRRRPRRWPASPLRRGESRRATRPRRGESAHHVRRGRRRRITGMTRYHPHESRYMDTTRIIRRFRMTAVFIAVAAVIMPFAVSGCAEGERATDDELIILSPHWEGIQQEFEAGFQKWWKERTGRTVDITWLDQGGTSQIMRFIRSEYSADSTGIGIDMMFGGGIDPYLKLVSDSVLQPCVLPDTLLSRLPREFAGIPMYDSSGLWYGATLSGFGIIANSAVGRLQGLPPAKTWEDMADPRASGWISAGDPRMSGSVHMAYEIMLQAYGWERGWQIITALSANSRSFARSAGQVPLAVARGDAASGMCIDFYAWSEITHMNTTDLTFVYPENLTAINPDGIAILKGAPHEKVAEAFLLFVMSEPGQKIWAFKRGAPGGPEKNQLTRFAVLPDMYGKYRDNIAVDINPFAWKITFIYDSDKGSKRWSLVNDMIGTLLIDSHDELSDAWGSVRARNTATEALPALARPPISEDDAMAFAEKWDDQEFRNATIGDWTRFARAKYGAVKRGDADLAENGCGETGRVRACCGKHAQCPHGVHQNQQAGR